MFFLKSKGLPIKKSGIYKATMRHDLKFSKFGRSLIFHKSDVLAWIEQNTTLQTSPQAEASETLSKQANRKLNKSK